jgi:thiamine-monophosphate kinase
MPETPEEPRLSEEEVIRLVQSLAGETTDEQVVGIGDDAAVLHLGGAGYCVTTDMLVEGVHFDLAYTRPVELGRKAMAANLSDLAAMGARPRWGFLSLGLPAPPAQRLVEGILGGVMEMCHRHAVNLAGGDTVRAPQVVLNLCLVGAAGPAGAVLRSGARPGDAVCVSGRLGAAAGGLAWLAGGGGRGDAEAGDCLRAFLDPAPRVAAGRALAESGRLHAMMDLSDGLATDLARLAVASQAGARLREKRLPVDQATRGLAARLGADPLEWALRGGEDFELLFACAPDDVPLLAQLAAEAEDGLAVTRVGEITAGRGVSLVRAGGREEEVSFGGYDHFRRSEP